MKARICIALALLAACSLGSPWGSAGQVGPEGASYAAGVVSDGGILMGRVRFGGPVPVPEMLPVGRNTDHCGTQKASEALLVGPGGGLRNVVVRIMNIRRGKAFPAGSLSAVLDQQSCVYVPHVQVIPLGSRLELVNSDPILHNVHGYLDSRTVFNLAMPLENQRIPRTLNAPGIIRLQCDAGHTWMSAYVVVADNPYYALTGESGDYQIGDLPPGEYRVSFWHEKLGEQIRVVRIAARGTARQDLEMTAGR